MPESPQGSIHRAREVGQPSTHPAEGKPRSRIWHNRSAQKILSLATLLGAAAAEWVLVNKADTDVGKQFNSPATVSARNEMVTFTAPASMNGGSFSLIYLSPPVSERVIVNAFFDNAQLSDETLKTLQQLLVSAPSSPGVITHVTSGPSGASCTTNLQVEPGSSSLKTVEFSQGDSDISNSYRALGVRFIETDAIVTLTPYDALSRGRSNCKFVLSIGDWTQPTPGFIPIKIRVPPGVPFRFRWQKLDERSSAWMTEGSALSLLEFGSSKSNEFLTQAIAIKPLNPETGASHDPAKLEARGSKQSPLTVLFFGINQNQLEIKASGRGRTVINGTTVHVDLLQKLNEYPLPSALLAAANLALIGWVKRTFFPTRHNKPR